MLGIHKPENVAGSSAPAIIIGVFVAFGGILFGYDTGTIGGILAMEYWIKEFADTYDKEGKPYITSSQSSLIVSILSAGTFFGALTAAPFGDFLGRRWGLIASCVVFSLGVIFQTAATETALFSVGRFVAGYGVGLVSALVPLYQSESSPKWIRGAIVGAYQLAITIGLFLAACVNQATHARQDSGSYRIPIAVQFAWALILIGGMLILPETPRYLIKRGKYDEAAQAMSRLRRLPVDHPVLLEELNEIKANHEFETQMAQGGYIDCIRGGMLKRLLTGMGLQALQQLTGINFIFYYGTNFFKESGIENPFLIGLTTNLVNVVSTIPGLWLVERMGRRNLLFFGAVGMCIAQFIVAIVGVTTTSVVANKVLIAFVCIYIFFFACSWGPVAWVVTGELFPLKVRAKALSITTATNWLLNFAIGYATPYLVDSGKGNANLGSKVFFIWGGCCFICMVFVYMFIYETKGLSLEEIDELYETVSNAWQSMHFKPTMTFQQRIHHDEKVEVAHVTGDVVDA
ncbi:general substrate transporter [Kalaharituber pfeilii]|nr:general substrate transporter [Kalaharituber pfeilii]